MSYVIKIEGMEFRARHGCYDVEQRVGGNFTADITLTIGDSGNAAKAGNGYDPRGDAASRPADIPAHTAQLPKNGIMAAIEADDISRTVNYVDVYEVVRAEMNIPSRIIENVALRIVKAVRTRFPQVERVEITIAKLAPPIGGKAARVAVNICG